MFARPGIDKIQLPSSMQKVGPSESSDIGDCASLIINQTFPSQCNMDIANTVFMGQPPPPKKRTPKKICDMFIALLEQLKVPEAITLKYSNARYVGSVSLVHFEMILNLLISCLTSVYTLPPLYFSAQHEDEGRTPCWFSWAC